MKLPFVSFVKVYVKKKSLIKKRGKYVKEIELRSGGSRSRKVRVFFAEAFRILIPDVRI